MSRSRLHSALLTLLKMLERTRITPTEVIGPSQNTARSHKRVSYYYNCKPRPAPSPLRRLMRLPLFIGFGFSVTLGGSRFAPLGLLVHLHDFRREHRVLQLVVPTTLELQNGKDRVRKQTHTVRLSISIMLTCFGVRSGNLSLCNSGQLYRRLISEIDRT